MVRDVWTELVRGPLGEEIIVAKVAKGTVQNRWTARKLVNALRARLPLGKIGLEVVVMDGEPIETPTPFGTSPEAESYVRTIVPKLATYVWKLSKLDW